MRKATASYNCKISVRANNCIQKRRAVVALERRALILSIIAVISVLILLGSTMITFASSKESKGVLCEEYVSIQIQPGDSLWSLAAEYTQDTEIKACDYIDEVTELNQLKSDEIHSGQYLVVPHYYYEAQ